eukprot:1237260-Pyramimonas_sp.AAC.1
MFLGMLIAVSSNGTVPAAKRQPRCYTAMLPHGAGGATRRGAGGPGGIGRRATAPAGAAINPLIVTQYDSEYSERPS